MGWVAVAALASWTVATVLRKWQDGAAGVFIICAVGAAFGVAAVRFPLATLAPLPVIWIITTAVDHPGVLEISGSACFIGWFLGAPAGLIARQLRGERPPFTARRRSGRGRS
jgi:hypothetical protein